MAGDPAPNPEAGAPRFTHLFARITEEEDGYVVQVRLHNGVMLLPDDAASDAACDAAWGEEIADSIETASKMIAILATRFCISQDRVTLEIRMDNMAENTRH